MKNISLLFILLMLALPGIKANDDESEIEFIRLAYNEDAQLETQSKRVFKLTDDLLLRVELDKPLLESYRALSWEYRFDDQKHNFNYALKIFINGKQHDIWLFELPPDEFRNSTEIPMVLQTSNNKLAYRNAYMVNQWKDLIVELGEGLYEVKIEFIPVYVNTLDTPAPAMATGSFKLDVNQENKLSLGGKNTGMLPEPTVINNSLEEDILDASQNVFSHLEPVQAIITDVESDWSYRTDEHGNILRRYLIASVVYEDLLEGGCEVKSGVYFQDHQGYGRFSETFYLKSATGYFAYDLPCTIEESRQNTSMMK